MSNWRSLTREQAEIECRINHEILKAAAGFRASNNNQVTNDDVGAFLRSHMDEIKGKLTDMPWNSEAATKGGNPPIEGLIMAAREFGSLAGMEKLTELAAKEFSTDEKCINGLTSPSPPGVWKIKW